MNKHIIKLLLLVIFLQQFLFGQFGQNKVQYKDFTWYYIQTDHFDIYFSQHGASLAEFTAKAAEDALKSIENSFNYKINTSACPSSGRTSIPRPRRRRAPRSSAFARSSSPRTATPGSRS